MSVNLPFLNSRGSMDVYLEVNSQGLCSRVFVPRLHFLPRFYVKGVGPRTTRTHVS